VVEVGPGEVFDEVYSFLHFEIEKEGVGELIFRFRLGFRRGFRVDLELDLDFGVGVEFCGIGRFGRGRVLELGIEGHILVLILDFRVVLFMA
jgi:hypothetical protein